MGDGQENRTTWEPVEIDGGDKLGALSYLVKAEFDFTSRQGDELTFLQDDLLVVFSDDDGGWLAGEVVGPVKDSPHCGSVGLLPFNYVARYDLPVSEDLKVEGENCALSAARVGRTARVLMDVSSTALDSLVQGDLLTIVGFERLKKKHQETPLVFWKCVSQQSTTGDELTVCPSTCQLLPETIVKSARKR